MEAKIIDSWTQVDGGTRYLMETEDGEVSVDEKEGKLSGFARPNFRGDEREGLVAAFNAIRLQQSIAALKD
jgi:hypothetical protein